MRLKKTTKKRDLFFAITSLLAGLFVFAILLFITMPKFQFPNKQGLDEQITDNQVTNLTTEFTLSDYVSENIPLLGKNEYNSVPVLMYHHIGTKYDGYLRQFPGRVDSNVVKEEHFIQQIIYLSENGYYSTNMSTLVSVYKNKFKLPPKTIVLTFDDGYRDFYSSAFPILKKYHMQATINIITDYIGYPDHLTWEMLKEIRNSGLITIASHSKSHPSMPTLTASRIVEEAEISKHVLEEGLGIKITDFCYPSGSFNDNVVNALQTAGYTDAVTTQPGKWKANIDPFKIPRQRISYNNSLEFFKKQLL